MIYCGIDWAEKTHDVALVDDSGQLLAKRHITDDAAGYKILLDLLAEYGDTEGTRSRSRSRHPAACWSPCWGPASGRCSRSTRRPPPATATG